MLSPEQIVVDVERVTCRSASASQVSNSNHIIPYGSSAFATFVAPCVLKL